MTPWALEHGGETLWRGDAGTAPTPAGLLRAAASASASASGTATADTEGMLTAWTFEILRNAPSITVGPLLATLCCAEWGKEYTEMGKVLHQRVRPVCGHVFKRGEIVWTCRTCAKDQTCVQCNECFLLSDHSEHETFFHPAGGVGGSCDCGDPEAWAKGGNCSCHSGGSDASVDLLDSVPPELQRGLRIVMRAALSFLISYTVSSVRAFQRAAPCSSAPHPSSPVCELCGSDRPPVGAEGADELHCQPNPFAAAAHAALSSTAPLTLGLCIHNDDVHTYNDVIACLTRGVGGAAPMPGLMDLGAAEATTSRVDSDGQACILTRVVAAAKDYSEMQTRMDYVGRHCGLLTSLAPVKLLQLDTQAAALVEWVMSLGKLHDGVQHIISQAMVEPWWTEAWRSHPALQIPCLDFPGVVPACEAFPRSEAAASHDPVTQSTPSGCVPPFPVYVQHLVQEERFRLGLREALKHTGEAVELEESAAPTDRFWEVQRAVCPLLNNTGLQVPLSIMVLSSPYLFKAVRVQLNALVVVYQQDPLFKAGFSQTFTCLYSALHALKFRGVNTASDDIFSNSVQIYTANGIVTTMSSDGLGAPSSRLLPEVQPVHISKMLVQAAHNAMLDLGARPSREGDSDFLLSNAITNRRLTGVFKDTEYVTENSLGNLRVLAGRRDPGAVEAYLQLCELLQGLDPMTRKVDSHVEMEDMKWLHAANLLLELEGSTTNLLCNALFPSQELLDSERQACSVAAGHDSSELADEALRVVLAKAARAVGQWAQRQELHGASHQYQIRCFGEMCTLPSLVEADFSVLRDPVSVHIPLHRFLSKILLYSAYRGLDLSQGLHLLAASPHVAMALLDYPLRNMVFAGQASAGLWVRNGMAASNLAFNYNRAPLCRMLRDVDLLSLQVSIKTLGTDVFVALAIQRFGLDSLFALAPSASASGDEGVADEIQVLGLSEMLKTMANVLVNLPPVLEASSLALHQSLDVAVVNHVLGGASTMGALASVKCLVGNPKAIRDSSMRAAADRCCVKRIGADGKAILEVSPERYAFHDPLHPHLAPREADRALQMVTERLKADAAAVASSAQERPKGPSRYRPLVSLSILLPSHPDLDIRPAFLSSLSFLRLARRSLSIRLTLPSTNTAPGVDVPCSGAVLERLVYLLTLRELLASSLPPLVGPAIDEERGIFESLLLIAKMESSSDIGNNSAGGAGSAGLEGPYREGLLWLVCSMASRQSSSLAPDASSSSGDVGLRLRALGVAEIWGLPALSSSFSAGGGGGSSGGGDDGGGMDRSELARRKAAAQARAKAMMSLQVAAFTAAEGPDEEEEEMDVSGSAEKQEADEEEEEDEDEGPECVICHDTCLAHNGNPIGFLGLAQASSTQAAALLCDRQPSELRCMFRVVPIAGCVVYKVPDLGAGGEGCNVVGHLQQGQHVTASLSESTGDLLYHPYDAAAATAPSTNGGSSSTRTAVPSAPAVRLGTFLRVISPLDGWIPFYQPYNTVLSQDGPSWRLAPGPVPKASGQNSTKSRSDLVVNLAPLSRLLFNQHGPQRHHISTCGHAMHFTCYAKHKISSITNGSNVLSQCVDTLRGELMCPLCRAVCNTLVRRTDRALARKLLPPASTSHGPSADGGGKKARFMSPLLAAAADLLAEPEESALGWEGPAPACVDVPNSAELLSVAHANITLKTIQDLTMLRLPWVPDLHFKSDKLKLPWLSGPEEEAQFNAEYECVRGAHTLCAAVAYSLSSAVHARRWGHWAAGLAASAGAPRDNEASSELLHHLVLLLRYLPLSFVRTPPGGGGAGATDTFLADFVRPLKWLLAGGDVSDWGLSSTRRGRMHLVDASHVSPSIARRVLLTLPFETSPSLGLPDNRRRNKILQVCAAAASTPGARAMRGGELWAFLRVPVLSQDLATLACCVAACGGRYLSCRHAGEGAASLASKGGGDGMDADGAAPAAARVQVPVHVSSPLGGDSLLVLVWAKVCQSVVEPAAQGGPEGDSDPELEAGLRRLQTTLGLPAREPMSTGEALPHVLASLGPYLSLLLLLRRGRGASRGSEGGEGTGGSALSDADRLLSALDCPPLHALLQGNVSVAEDTESCPLWSLAARWGRQYWNKIDRTGGRVGCDDEGDNEGGENGAENGADGGGLDSAEPRVPPPWPAQQAPRHSPAPSSISGMPGLRRDLPFLDDAGSGDDEPENDGPPDLEFDSSGDEGEGGHMFGLHERLHEEEDEDNDDDDDDDDDDGEGDEDDGDEDNGDEGDWQDRGELDRDDDDEDDEDGFEDDDGDGGGPDGMRWDRFGGMDGEMMQGPHDAEEPFGMHEGEEWADARGPGAGAGAGAGAGMVMPGLGFLQNPALPAAPGNNLPGPGNALLRAIMRLAPGMLGHPVDDEAMGQVMEELADADPEEIFRMREGMGLPALRREAAPMEAVLSGGGVGLPSISLPAAARGSWAQNGVDPEYLFVDEPIMPLDLQTLSSALAAVHSLQPLQGSVTGLANCFGVNGERVTGGGGSAAAGAAASAASAAAEEAPSAWDCPACTLINSIHSSRCDACDSPRPRHLRPTAAYQKRGSGPGKDVDQEEGKASEKAPALPSPSARGEPTHPWADISHLSVPSTCPPLVMPPDSFNDLYHMATFPHRFVPEAALPADVALPPEARFATLEGASVCLVCGAFVSSGTRQTDNAPSVSNPGECTLHARSCGAGVGMFFLLQRHAVLLVRGDGRSALWVGAGTSLYVDEYGESGPASGQGSSRPLHLSLSAWRRLVDLWTRHEVAREVVRTRSSTEKVIRPYYY